MKTKVTKGDLCANIVVPKAGPRRYEHLLERSRLEERKMRFLLLGRPQTLRGNALPTLERKTMFYLVYKV